MDTIEYLDFDLMIERTGKNAYRARVLASPAGQAIHELSLPFSEIELENFFLRIGRPRRGVRRLESPEMENAKLFGGKLFRAVFDDEMLSTLHGSLDESRKQGRGLRIRLRLNDAPELVNLPWEYLYNPTLNRFLSLSINTPLVRYLELSERINPILVKPPLHVLALISSPSNYPVLDVELEWANLKKALSGLETRSLLTLDRLEVVTPVALQHALRRKDYHIFHFIGHGGFNEQSQDGILLFEDENKFGRPLSGQYLGTILHDERTLRLAVLNACEGARSGTNDPFAGVAQSLVQQGLPAVIAMQFEITDEAAIVFGREFYTAIAEGYPVDAALAEARKAIFSLGNDIEWGTPVLYMRAPDGRIFDVDKTTAEQEQINRSIPPSRPAIREPNPDLEAIYVNGLSAFWLKDWACAEEYFIQIEKEDPNYKDVPAKLAECRQKLEISRLETQADEAAANEHWTAAVEALEELSRRQPGEENLAERLESARHEARLAELYAQARQLYHARQWQAVINIFQQIHALQAAYPDPDGLMAGAKAELDSAQREEKLVSLYGLALKAVEAENLKEAINFFNQVKALDADYKDTLQHLARLKSQLEAEKADGQHKKERHLRNAIPAASRPIWIFWAIGGAAVVGLIFLGLLINRMRIADQGELDGVSLGETQTAEFQQVSQVEEPALNWLMDEFTSNEYGWSESETEDFSAYIEDEVYWMEMWGVNQRASSFIPLVIEPKSILFDAEVHAGYGSYGVNCNYQDEDNFYEVRFEAASAEYAVWQKQDGEWNPLGEGYSGLNYFFESENLNYGIGATNTFWIDCQPQFIEVTINSVVEQQILLDEPAEPGRMALVMYTWDSLGEEGYQVSFDNVQVGNGFYDTFLANINSWDEGEFDEYSLQIVDSSYVFQANQPNLTLTSFPSLDFQPSIVMFKAAADTTEGSYGLYCNYHDEDNFYEIRFESSASRFSIWRYTGGSVRNLQEGDFVEADGMRIDEDQPNLFFINCLPGYISLTVNFQQVAELEFDDPLEELGSLALFIKTWETLGEDGFRVVFDSFAANE